MQHFAGMKQTKSVGRRML